MNNSLRLTVTFLLVFFTFSIFFGSLRDNRRWKNIFVDIYHEKKTEDKKKITEKESAEERSEEEKDLDGDLSFVAGAFLLAIPIFFLLRYLVFFALEYFLRNGFIDPSVKAYDGNIFSRSKENLSAVKKFYNDERCWRYVDDEIAIAFSNIYNYILIPDCKANIGFIFLFGFTLLFSLCLSLVVVFYAFNFYKNGWQSTCKRSSLQKKLVKLFKLFKFDGKSISLAIAVVIFITFFVIWFFEEKEKAGSFCINQNKMLDSSYPFFLNHGKYIDISDKNTVSFRDFVRFNCAYAKIKKIFEETIGDDFDYFYQKHFKRNKELVDLREKRIKEEEKEITNFDQFIKKNSEKKRLQKRSALEQNKRKLERLLQECKAEKKKIEAEIRNVYKNKKEELNLKCTETEIDEMLKYLLSETTIQNLFEVDKNDEDNNRKREKYLDLLYSYKYAQKGIELAKMGIDISIEYLSDLDNGKDDEYSWSQDFDYLFFQLEKGITLAEICPTEEGDIVKKSGIVITYDNHLQYYDQEHNSEKKDIKRNIISYFSGDKDKKLILLSIRIQSLQEEKEEIEKTVNSKLFHKIEYYYDDYFNEDNRNIEEREENFRNVIGKEKIKRYFEIKKEILKNKKEYLKIFSDFLMYKDSQTLNDEAYKPFKNSLLRDLNYNKVNNIFKTIDKAAKKIENERRQVKMMVNSKANNNEQGAKEEIINFSDEVSDEMAGRMVGGKFKETYDSLDEIDKDLDSAGFYNFQNFLFLATKNQYNDDLEFVFSKNELFGSEVLFERIAKILLTKKRIETNDNFLKKKINEKNDLEKIIEETNYEDKDEQERELFAKEIYPEGYFLDDADEKKSWNTYKKEIADLDRDLLFLNHRIKTTLGSLDKNYRATELWEAYQDKKNTEEALDQTMKKYSLKKLLSSQYEDKLEARNFFMEQKRKLSKPNNEESNFEMIMKKNIDQEVESKIYEAYKYLKKDFPLEKKKYFEALEDNRRQIFPEDLDYYQQVADNYYLFREQFYNYKKQRLDDKNSYNKLQELLKRKNKVKKRLAKRNLILRIKSYMDKLNDNASFELKEKFPKSDEVSSNEEHFLSLLSDGEKTKLNSKYYQLSEETDLQWRINLREIDEELKEKKDLFQECFEKVNKLKKSIEIKEEEESEDKSEDNKNIHFYGKNYIETVGNFILLNRPSPDAAEEFYKNQDVQNYLKITEEIGRLRDKREKLLTYRLVDAAQDIEKIRDHFFSDEYNRYNFYYTYPILMKINNNKEEAKKEQQLTVDDLVTAGKNYQIAELEPGSQADDQSELSQEDKNFAIYPPVETEDRYFSAIAEFDIAQTLLGISSMVSDEEKNFNRIVERFLPLRKEKKKEREAKKRMKECQYGDYPIFPQSKNLETIDDDELEKIFIKKRDKKIVRDYQRSFKKLKNIKENIRQARMESKKYRSNQGVLKNLNRKIKLQETDIAQEEFDQLKNDFCGIA